MKMLKLTQYCEQINSFLNLFQVGRTPFIQALLNTNVRLARLLLAHGADVNTVYQVWVCCPIFNNDPLNGNIRSLYVDV